MPRAPGNNPDTIKASRECMRDLSVSDERKAVGSAPDPTSSAALEENYTERMISTPRFVEEKPTEPNL